MTNSNLLKEAIADAKAVRETALANAKIALEEAFTPRIQSMLSARIAEEEGTDYEMEEDAEAPEEHLVVEIIAPPSELTFERLTVSPTARTMPPQTKKPPTNKGGRLTCLMLMVGTNPRLRQCHWRSIAAQRLSRCYRTSKSGFSITNTDEDCNEHFQDHRSRHWPHSFRSDRLIQRSGSRHAC